MNDPLISLRKRLLYQSSHRGMKELDKILLAFSQKYLLTFNEQQLHHYEYFLTMSEAEIYGYLIRQQPLPDSFLHVKMAVQIQDFVQQHLFTGIHQ